MILHTIINPYDVFPVPENSTQSGYENFNGGTLEYKMLNGEKKIVRLHSTDPYNYLKSEFNPFSILK